MTTRSFLFAALLAACGGSQTPPAEGPAAPPPTGPAEPPATASEPAPPAEPPAAPEAPKPPPIPDAVTASPDTHKEILANDSVRVLEITVPPGKQIPKHQHPDSVLYVLSPAKMKMTVGEEQPTEMEMKPNTAVFRPAMTHSAENVGKTELKAVMVELKKGGTAAPAGDDAVKVAAKMHKVVLDEAKVRVMEVTFKKKQKMAKHTHPDHVIYVVKPGKLKLTPAEGEAKEMETTAGQAMFSPATVHAAENTGGGEFKAIVFELKP